MKPATASTLAGADLKDRECIIPDVEVDESTTNVFRAINNMAEEAGGLFSPDDCQIIWGDKDCSDEDEGCSFQVVCNVAGLDKGDWVNLLSEADRTK